MWRIRHAAVPDRGKGERALPHESRGLSRSTSEGLRCMWSMRALYVCHACTHMCACAVHACAHMDGACSMMRTCLCASGRRNGESTHTHARGLARSTSEGTRYMWSMCALYECHACTHMCARAVHALNLRGSQVHVVNVCTVRVSCVLEIPPEETKPTSTQRSEYQLRE